MVIFLPLLDSFFVPLSQLVVELLLELPPEVPFQEELLLAAVQLPLQLLDAALRIFMMREALSIA